MKETPRLMITAVAAVLLLLLLLLPPAGRASSPLSVTSGPAPNGEDVAQLLTAIKPANTSMIVQEPKCGNGTGGEVR